MHFRNLPLDAHESEILALCAPFGGTVHQVKRGVGSLASQAFVEFDSLDTAIRVTSLCAEGNNSTKPVLLLRGRPIYVQFSTKQQLNGRIVAAGVKRGRDDAVGDAAANVPSPVVLITFEGLPVWWGGAAPLCIIDCMQCGREHWLMVDDHHHHLHMIPIPHPTSTGGRIIPHRAPPQCPQPLWHHPQNKPL